MVKGKNTPREFLKKSALTGLAGIAIPSLFMGVETLHATSLPNASFLPAPFELPPLPYAFDALEPHIDKQTMEIHHDKHHGAYATNLNKALESVPALKDKPIEALLADNCSILPEEIRTPVRNNGGGHINHSMVWQIMAP